MKTLMVVLVLASGVAHAQMLAFLVKQWSKNGQQFCQYDNGTVLNVGAGICPLNIKV